jgi:hypothetical protein
MKLYKVIVIIIIMEPIIIFIIIFSSFVGIVVSVKLYNKYCKQQSLDDTLLDHYITQYPQLKEIEDTIPLVINDNRITQ